MDHIIKIVKALEDSGLLKEGVSITIEYEVKEQKLKFFSMLIGTLGASLLGDSLTGIVVIRAGKATIRAGQDF